MHKLSYLILLIALTFSGFAQSPHGEGFKIDCTVCHTSESWKVLKAKTTFDHNTTNFKLSGQHSVTDCSSCHKSLKFKEAKSECIACHTDMHRNTLGQDCARCHSTQAWIIPNTSIMHQQSRFPLQGNHAVVECSSCHKSASDFQFEPLSIECVSCHRVSYLATTSPNHQKAGYSTNCNECHGVKSTGWDASSFEHGFFPLTGGHGSINCAECHTDDAYQKISNDCVTCHQKDYNSTTKPNHQQTRFSTSCAECHTTSPGWNPANFKQHDDQYFPIYSGNHKGEWDRCTDCHTANTYASFSCIDCHEHSQSKMNNEHEGTSGYTYRSVSCYSCHPKGDKSGAFSHNTTNFPLTGKHSTTDCLACHTKGFAGTSSECSVCHQANYSNAQTPSHTKAGLSSDCKICHTTTAWQPSGFKHGTTGFELTGGHAAIVQCSSCHAGSTTTAKPECISCHQVQYTNAKGHVTSKFPTDCRMCHTSENWIKTTFNHNTTNFPLTGSHLTAQCASCHSTGYIGTSTECKSCHQTNYTNAQTPSHSKAGLPFDCKICHSSTAWQPSTFKHGTTGFELTGGHAAIVQCSSCHAGSTTTAKPECISCHQVQYTNAKGHVTSKFPTDCRMCHTSENWVKTTFNHNTTNFPLTGSHLTAQCASCHSTGYIGTSTECKSCHQTNYTNAQTPSHSKAGLPVDCKICHSSTAWQPSTFKHGTTGFELTGGHAAIVQCSACHLGSITTASAECFSCHQVQYTNAKGHVASKFPTDCRICHTSANWLQTSFNHNATTFPLTGAHVAATCASCHSTGYAGTSTLCNSCHQPNYTNAQLPSHIKAGIPVDCKTCHTSTAWQPSTFKHGTTGFELTGAHAAIVQCSACHLGSTTTASYECISCHQVQYTNAKGHVASKFPTDCRMCHTSANWLQTSFNHNATAFPLTGAHVTATCASCHSAGYAGTSTLCNSCHQPNYTNAQLPSHIKAGLPVDCKICHTSTAWQPSTFKHGTTGFELTGAHAAIVQCSACHLGSTTTASSECISCHQVQYTNAKGHVASKFPTDCRICHTSVNWLQTSFNHNATTFPLTGAHVKATCASCHSAGYAGTSAECNSCHQTNYNTAQSPSHSNAGLPVDCKICHTSAAWQPSSFKHGTTGFELTGAHAAIVQCSACHLGSTTTASAECFSCHQVQYTNAKGHVASKFPTDCRMCHSSVNWLQTTFNHNTTNFPLTGAHVTATCASCHSGGYAGTSAECNSCHQTNYNTAQSPSHSNAGLPVDCKICHTSAAWQPSSFKHGTTGFELTGGHAAIVQCSACHAGSTTTASAECFSCHQVQYTNAKGHVASKFPTDCRMCHTSVNWLQTTFNHNATAFPLTGAHTTATCASCHSAGYAGTSADCNSCHQANYTAATNPNHKTLALPVTCAQCHTTNPGWQPASFAIHNTYYALTGAHAAIASDCAACHNGVYNNIPKTCYTCHATDYKNTTNPSHATAQFPTDCAGCHSVTAWSPSTFNHDAKYFPIYSGKHSGKWTLCSECHTSTSNYAVFSCIKCHEHSNKTSVDDDHKGVNGYTYTAISCYTCHPTGN